MHHPILVYGLTGYGIFVAAALYLWQRLYLESGIEAFDKDLARMKKQYDELKAMLKAEKEAGQLPDERFIL